MKLILASFILDMFFCLAAREGQSVVTSSKNKNRRIPPEFKIIPILNISYVDQLLSASLCQYAPCRPKTDKTRGINVF